MVRSGTDLTTLPRGLSDATLLAYDGTTRSAFEAVESARPATVFHLASHFRAEHAPEDVVPMIASNVLFGTQLLEALARVGQPSTGFVNVGTSWQHFGDAEYDPVCLYAATKQAFADVLLYFVHAEGLRATTLSPFDTYGPDDPRPKLIALLERATRSDDPLPMSPGEQLLELVYIDDVIEALLAAEDLLARGEIGDAEEFAVTAGEQWTLRQVADAFAAVTGRVPNIEWGGRPYRHREVMAPWRNGVALPGWSAEVGLKDGLRRLVDARGVSIG